MLEKDFISSVLEKNGVTEPEFSIILKSLMYRNGCPCYPSDKDMKEN